MLAMGLLSLPSAESLPSGDTYITFWADSDMPEKIRRMTAAIRMHPERFMPWIVSIFTKIAKSTVPAATYSIVTTIPHIVQQPGISRPPKSK